MPEKILFHAEYDEVILQIDPEQRRLNLEKIIQCAKTETIRYIPISEKIAKIPDFTETAIKLSKLFRYDLIITQDESTVRADYPMGKNDDSYSADMDFFRPLMRISDGTLITPDTEPYKYCITFLLLTHSTHIGP